MQEPRKVSIIINMQLYLSVITVYTLCWTFYFNTFSFTYWSGRLQISEKPITFCQNSWKGQTNSHFPSYNWPLQQRAHGRSMHVKQNALVTFCCHCATCWVYIAPLCLFNPLQDRRTPKFVCRMAQRTCTSPFKSSAVGPTALASRS